ncbi:MAG: extracellular solute-binding protein [Catenulispora sp.]|nr:extracellular solute-binding protein [Catenulispora sp.]
MAPQGLRIRRATALALALAATAAVGACGSSSSPKGSSADAKQTIRFVWWGNQDRATATQQAVKLFMDKHPNITVQTEFAGYAAYFQKLSTQIAGGAAPDLIQVDRSTYSDYLGRHVLADLTPYVKDKKLDLSQIAQNLLGGVQYNGDQYAVPAGQTTQMVAYDKTMFDKAGVSVPADGWTWSQFSDAMAKVAAANGTTGTTDFGWAVDWFEAWLHQHGKQLYTEDGKLGFTADDLTQFWTMTGTMRAAKGVSGPQDTTKMDGTTQNSAFVRKTAASEFNYDSNLTSYISSYGSQVAAAPLPSDDPSKSGMAALPPVYFAVPKTSSHQAAAVELLNFLANDPAAGTTLGATRGTPANQQIRTQVCGSATGGNKAVCDYETAVAGRIGTSAGWMWPKGSAAIKTDFQKVYDDVIFGRSSVSEAAARVISDAKQSLGQ